MNKKAKISAIERDERSIALPIRIPLAKALVGLKSSILEAIVSGDFSLIETFCHEKLLPLLEVQSELAYLKGGRRAELSAKKVVNESVVEFAPVKLSLGDDGEERARGVIEYLRRISGLDPSKAKTKFDKHIAGAIGDLSKEITSEVKKAVEDLTLKNVHLRGGKAKILQTLLENGVQVTNTPALAETLFRTQSQQAYAAGRWNTAIDSDIGDYIWGFEYVTAGDDRVREGHRVLEGVRLPKEDPFWKKYFPPNGWNCRCTTLEIWKDEPTAKIDFGITGRDPRKRTPSAMNVPSEFRGNVGIFATPKISSSATKNPSKTVERTYKKPKNERIYYFGESSNHATGGPSENPVNFSVSPTYAKTPKRWTKIKEENPSEKERERAEIYASSLFRFNGKDRCIPVSFANLDSETINYYCSTLHTVVQELPIVRNLVSKIHVRTDSLGLGSFDIEERSLGLSMTSFKEMKETCKQKFNSRPRHFSTADVRATVFHEIGHALFTEILSFKDKYPQIKKLEGEFKIFANESKNPKSPNFLSWYAGDSAQELVAEAVACHFCRNTRKTTARELEIPATEYVINKLREILKLIYPQEEIL